MAELAKGFLRKKIPELQLALKGKLEEHHRFLLELQLQRLETAEKDLAALEQRIGQKLAPYAAQLALLDTRNPCLFIDLAGIPQPRPGRGDVHYRVREPAMVREVPDYARQYPIETPRIRPLHRTPCSAGALAREAAKAVAQREAKAEPQPAQPRRKVWRQTQPRSGERTQPTAQAVGRTRKQSSSEGAKEPSPIHPRTRSRTRKNTNGSNPPKPRSPAQWQGNWRDLRTVFEFAGISEPSKEAPTASESAASEPR